jgi:hypothetical protein
VGALTDSVRPVPTSWAVSRDDFHHTVFCTLAEARLVRAYLALFLVPWNDGVRSACLARFGAYEVRLTECAEDPRGEGFPLWIDLYRHDTCRTLDTCGCEEFDEAVRVADEFITWARGLYLQSAQA